MTHAPSPIAFALPTKRPSALPIRIVIPAGTVTAQNNLFLHSRSILGFFLSGRVAVIRIPRWRTQDPAMLIEQLVGWLCGRGYSVVRVRIFFPLLMAPPAKPAPSRVDEWVIHAVRTHLARLSVECPRDLPLPARMPAAIRDVLRAGVRFWRDTAALLHGLESTDSNLMLAIAPTLFDVARAWEFRIARFERRVRNEGWVRRGDINQIAACDRAWKTCVDYLPAYKIRPEATARLL
jgi:hypothetical protein